VQPLPKTGRSEREYSAFPLLKTSLIARSTVATVGARA
jgi:hypothetical protein